MVPFTASEGEIGDRPCLEPVQPATGEGSEEHLIARLEREVEELRSANEILRRTARYFARLQRSCGADEEAD